MTPEQHYSQFGYQEGLAPNAYFDPEEYTLAKARSLFESGSYISIEAAREAFESAWEGNVYQHYLQYGTQESINPSNEFDESSYLEAKLAQLQENDSGWTDQNTVEDVREAFASAGLTPLGHFIQYGQEEGLNAETVPADEAVDVGEGGTPGDTFTLTSGVDALSGSENDDTFLAPGGSGSSSFNNLDRINGGEGYDTLVVEGDQTLRGTLSNIEEIRIQGDAAATYDVASISGLEQLWFEDQVGGSTSVLGLSDGQVGGAENSGADPGDAGSTAFNVDLGLASGSAANVALTDSTVNLGMAANSAAIDTLDAESDGTSAMSVSRNNGFAGGLRNITVTASGELALSGGSIGSDAAGEEVVFDASASDGNILVNDNILDAATSVTGGLGNDSLGQLSAATMIDTGAGNDTFNLAGNSADVTANTGEGNDLVDIIGATGSVSINTGAGDDLIRMESIASSASLNGVEGNDTVLLTTTVTNFNVQTLDAINSLQNVENLGFSADGVTADASGLEYDSLVFFGANATVNNLGESQTAIVMSNGSSMTVGGNLASTVNVSAQYNESVEGQWRIPSL
ncbi:hypothetical protein MHM84_11685 [Halomonas sp. McH1-25]|uniref:hypothetical protein n=1 Tax=unclassified Halomonas TaxID=2609666 RepID=UPI001EF6B7A2|nr:MULTISPECIES: hypothetical protein [unclassified Halomonas]MCG7600452.1 hypothetical protein [Halomonas sp. McH1-25]MCP1342949.1 hypothetical protein [Halomonas sp. FL8]MCP1359959.1 hypothetical protein [Halomonas sp. BBD45]MCP1364344.1 hypothetical protein [Halomonas sp. BBD48]